MTSAGDGERAARVPQHQRGASLALATGARVDRSAPCSSSQARVVVWRSRGTGASEKMRKTLLRALACSRRWSPWWPPARRTRCELQVGKIIVVTDGGFSPTSLPKNEDAPIKLHGFAKIETADGSTPLAAAKNSCSEFDKHGSVETRGLQVCTPGKLAATTTAQARKLCPGAIVGTGFGKAVVNFPEQRTDPGLLADHAVQRAAERRQPDRARATPT